MIEMWMIVLWMIVLWMIVSQPDYYVSLHCIKLCWIAPFFAVYSNARQLRIDTAAARIHVAVMSLEIAPEL